MITKEEVLNAFDIIEKYQEQERQKIKELEVESDKRSILILGLNTRELNCLMAANIKTIGELLSIDRFELRKFRNIGKKTIDGINRKLKDFGIETPGFRNKALDIVEAYHNQLNLSNVRHLREQLSCDLDRLDRNDFIKYMGGSKSQFLTLGNKYRLIRKPDIKFRKVVIENDAGKKMITNKRYFKGS